MPSAETESSIPVVETMPTVESTPITCYRDLQSTVAYTWPYSEGNIHYRLQPLTINPTLLHLAQREAFTRALLSMYDQRTFLESYKTTGYPTSSHRDEEKPKQSYVRLIGEAILNSPEKKLVLSEIYKTIQTKYPYFKNRGSGWKNSIRHNLSLNDCFVKLGRSPNGKGHFWTLSPQHYEEFLRGSSHQRKFQKKPAPKYCYYPSEILQFGNYTVIESSQNERLTNAASISPWPANRSERNVASPGSATHVYNSKSFDRNENASSSRVTSPVGEGRTVIHIPGDKIEVKEEVIVCSEDEGEKSLHSRPFDVENLLSNGSTRPASY